MPSLVISSLNCSALVCHVTQHLVDRLAMHIAQTARVSDANFIHSSIRMSHSVFSSQVSPEHGVMLGQKVQWACCGSPTHVALVELLQITLRYQSVHITLPDVELTIFRQVDRTSNVVSRQDTSQCRRRPQQTYPYSVCISPASFRTRTSINRSRGGCRLPVRSMSVHCPLYAANRSLYCRT